MNSICLLRIIAVSICSSVVSSLVPSLPIFSNTHHRYSLSLVHQFGTLGRGAASVGANTKNHSNRHIICHGKLAKSALSFKKYQYASPDDNYCNEDEIPMEEPTITITNNSHTRSSSRRRTFLLNLSTSSLPLLLNIQSANANVKLLDKPPPNPLNLKGTLWETGQLYEKSTTALDSNEDFFAALESTLEALHSPTLLSAIEEGKYGQASRLLRGGMMSESKMRLSANALIDLLPEDNDTAIYESNESFRVFLRYLDVLDAEVEAGSRPVGLGGSGEDNRIRILERVGMCEDAMKVFLKTVRAGLGVQS